MLRLGAIIENISEATMSGIKAGVGSTVAAGQLPKLLGVPGDPDATGFFHVLNGVLRQVGDANGATVVLSIVSVAALLAMGRLVPRVPGPLIVVAAGIALIAFTGLRDRGVALIAEVPQGIPLPGVPSLHDVADLLPGALAISVMAFLETVAVARGVRRPTEPQNDSGRVHRDRRRGIARGRDPRHVALRRRQSLGGSGVGLIFVAFGVGQLVRRRSPSDIGPEWMQQLSNAKPRGAFIMGAALSIVNPNLAIMISGTTVIAVADTTPGTAVFGTVLLLLAAGLDFLVPVGVYLAFGDRAKSALSAVKEWMITHERPLTLTVFFGFGALFVVRNVVALI
ncbi:GAP family protein [Prescottella equi]|uniref:GAP family protein n=3 Tax=Rhodococcus hoagii TaxID=43767 RepID=UPI0025766891|nr:GAP family protein [Prescottella equi]WJJ11320.1 GAP family protein [Prescottella equi]